MNGATGETFTYNELKDKIMRVASGLVRMGIKRGDVVTLFSPNCPEFAILYLAVIHIGGIISPLNPMYTPGIGQFQFQHWYVYKSQKIHCVEFCHPIYPQSFIG